MGAAAAAYGAHYAPTGGYAGVASPVGYSLSPAAAASAGYGGYAVSSPAGSPAGYGTSIAYTTSAVTAQGPTSSLDGHGVPGTSASQAQAMAAAAAMQYGDMS